MSSYRKMRRQARHVRRAGLQPIMIVNNDGRFPTPLGVILARWLWLFRSELAPVFTSAVVFAAGWGTHLAHPEWWPYIFLVSLAAAWIVALFGRKLGLSQLAERIYAVTASLTAGGWLAAAVLLGPLMSPLPQILGLGTLILAVPWWAHRRRRAKVRVERTLAAWPDISRAIGLTGSQIMSATVDLWGWRARVRLARGQTIADVMARIPAIESGFGTQRNAVRVHPTPDDLANRCELRVLNSDPHADAIPWRGPSVNSITQPIDLGPFEDAEPCRVSFLRRHAILAGATGSGKSCGLNELLGNLAACRDVVIWAIDLKRGMELRPWAPCIDRLATTPEEAAELLADATTILFARAQWLADHGMREWEPSERMPALVIIIDEYAELAEHVPDALNDTDTIARLGRAPAVTLVAATQRPTQKVMGQGAVRSQMNIRISFRVQEQRDIDLVLGQGMFRAGWHAHKLNAPGKFLVWSPEHDTPRRARAYLVTDNDVAAAVARYAPVRPRLDAVSYFALTNDRPEMPEQPMPTPQANPAPQADPEAVLWAALRQAPEEGISVTDLVDATGMSRRWIYYRLRDLAAEGRVVQTARGLWRVTAADDDA